jgi:L-lactate utilization protein LutB
MKQIIEKLRKSLETRDITAHIAASRDEAREIVVDLIPSDAVVGIGDSSSVRQIGAVDAIRMKGNKVINPFDMSKEINDLRSTFDVLFWPSIEATVCDVFLTGTNAITEDGKLVNVDGAGNRVAGMFWGHPISIMVVGVNKIVKDLEAAMDRVKNVVAPEHLKRKGAPAPCTKSGRCHDCVGPGKVCAITTIIERRPVTSEEMHVVIVQEDLGLSWDRSWPEDRINQIVNHHEKFMCECPLPAVVTQAGNAKEFWKMVRAKGKFVWSLAKDT